MDFKEQPQGPEFSPTTAKLRSILQTQFKLQEFRLGQLDVIHSLLEGRDAMAVMPTGGGKSLCYQLPALHKDGIAVIITPLISLMRDQVRSLRELGIASGCLFSDQALDEKRKVFSDLKINPSFILFLSPERVQKTEFIEWLGRQKISLFAIDEAHCISQWGSDFREDYHKLDILRRVRPDVPILALTATATPIVLDDIATQLQLKKPDRHVYGFYRPNLYYQVEICRGIDEKIDFLRQSLKQFPNGRVLVYCGTRKQAEDLVTSLRHGFSAMDFYHAGLSVEKRTEVQQSFEQGKIRILMATNAFGMGINHPDVRLVIHFQMPANIESYYQEAGRAGRDGKDSTCLLLYTQKDKGLHSYFITKSTAPKFTINRKWDGLNAITQFAEGGGCRHSGILTYFKDTKRIKQCGHCDTCLPHSARKIVLPIINRLAKYLPIKKRSPKLIVERPLVAQEELRAESLKSWRKFYADANDIPAFMVFSNKTLKELAIKNPRTKSDLQKVYGMGPHKVEHIGALIIEQLLLTD